MKRIVFVRLLLFGAIAAIPCAVVASDPPTRMITVNGEGQVQVDPDRAVLSFAVETNNKDLDEAKRDNDQRSRKLIATIKAMRIDPKDLRTDQLEVEPRYQGYPAKDFQGYYVRNGFTLTLRDLAKFEDVYDAVLRSGAEYVTGFRFESSKADELKARARELALKDAREKAKAMARTLDQSIGRPLTIQESSGQVSPWTHAFGVAAMKGMADPGPAIATGQISVKADVTVAFELKD